MASETSAIASKRFLPTSKLSRAAKKTHPIAPVKVTPGRVNRPRRGHRLARILPLAALELAEHHPAVAGRRVGEGAIPGFLRLALDVHRVDAAESFANLAKGGVKCLVKIFSQRAQGGVSDLVHKP